MKYAPWILLVLVVALASGLATWDLMRLRGFRTQVAELEVVRNQALAAVGHVQARADSAAAVADSLYALRQVELAEAAARARRLARQADSLSAAIGEMVPEGEVRDAVVERLAALRATYERRIADLEGVIERDSGVIASLRAEPVELRRKIASLEQALEVTTEQRDICMDAKGPGLWQRVRESAGPIGVALGVGLIAGLLAG